MIRRSLRAAAVALLRRLEPPHRIRSRAWGAASAYRYTGGQP